MYNIDSRFFFGFVFLIFVFVFFRFFFLDRHGPSVPTYLPQPRDYICSSLLAVYTYTRILL